MASLPVPIFLALRYLRPRRTYVSVISIISVIGVTLGVMVLILVISVMTGFDSELRRKILGQNAHITITSGGLMSHWQETAKKVTSRPHVTGAAPLIISPTLAKVNGRIITPMIRGIDSKLETKVSNLKNNIIRGSLDLDGEKIVIGSALARQLGLRIGDKLTIYSPKSFTDKKNAYLPFEPTITGIFETGMFEQDTHICCSLENSQDMFDLGNNVQALSVLTDNLERVPAVQADLNHILKPPLYAHTWMEMNRRLFSAIAVEKNMMYFILIFIIIVAAFGIMSTLITVTVQKTREIGILKSLGATPGGILLLFLAQGLIVGLIGTLLGLISGLTLLHYRNEFLELMRLYTGFELFPRNVYQFEQLPAQTSFRDLLIICGSAFIASALAGLFPAWRASRLQPARALRDY